MIILGVLHCMIGLSMARPQDGEAEEGAAPAEEGEAPALEKEAPAVEGEAPAEEGEAPAEGGEAPAEEGEAPEEAEAEKKSWLHELHHEVKLQLKKVKPLQKE